MFATKLKAGAVVLLASCTIAGLTIFSPAPPQDSAAEAGGRIFTSDGNLIYVNVYTTDPSAHQDFLYHHVIVDTLPEIKRARGVGTAAILGNREYATRIRLNPDHMRAHNLSPEDIKHAFRSPSMISSAEQLLLTMGESKEYDLTHIGRHNNKPEQYEDIILKVSPDGKILRLKDVGQVELDFSLFDISSDIDGHPAAAIVLKPAPGSNAAEVIEAVKEKLEYSKKEWPPGMEFEVVPLDRRNMVCAVIQTPRDSTLEHTSAKCQELGAIAKDIDGITSVSSLAGYQIRTERRDRTAGTCLIHLKDRSHRKLTSRQIVEKLEGKCRTMNVDIEFFEPPAVSVFVAAGGFSVRVLDKTNSNNDERPGRMPEMFMNDLLKRENLATLFKFFARDYSQYELVINNDVAVQKGVSIANAIESRFNVVGSDDQAAPKSQRLVEYFSPVSFKNDRGEMVPYSSFVQLKMKQGLNKIDR